MITFLSMDLDLTIEDARELSQSLRDLAAALRSDRRPEPELRAQRLEAIAKRVDRLLSKPALHYDPFH